MVNFETNANYAENILLWCKGKVLGCRSGGHSFKPFHRTYTLCIGENHR